MAQEFFNKNEFFLSRRYLDFILCLSIKYLYKYAKDSHAILWISLDEVKSYVHTGYVGSPKADWGLFHDGRQITCYRTIGCLPTRHADGYSHRGLLGRHLRARKDSKNYTW